MTRLQSGAHGNKLPRCLRSLEWRRESAYKKMRLNYKSASKSHVNTCSLWEEKHACSVEALKPRCWTACVSVTASGPIFCNRLYKLDDQNLILTCHAAGEVYTDIT